MVSADVKGYNQINEKVSALSTWTNAHSDQSSDVQVGLADLGISSVWTYYTIILVNWNPYKDLQLHVDTIQYKTGLSKTSISSCKLMCCLPGKRVFRSLSFFPDSNRTRT